MNVLKNVAVVMAIFATVAGVLVPLRSIANTQSQDCYNYDPLPQWPACVVDGTLPPTFWCKQLANPYPDVGCCSYTGTKTYYNSRGDGTICRLPFAFVITNANWDAGLTCYEPDSSKAPVNTDILNGQCTDE